MSKNQFPHLDELTDSREMLLARTPSFIKIFITLVVVIIIVAFAWMWFGEIDEVVTATGIVRPQNNVSVIHNVLPGKVTEFSVLDGQAVEQGMVLFSIDTTNLQQQLAANEQTYELLVTHLALIEQFLSSLASGKNQFETQCNIYYSRYLAYQTRYEQLALERENTYKRYEQEQRVSALPAQEIAALYNQYTSAQLALDAFAYEIQANLEQEQLEKQAALNSCTLRIQEIEEQILLSQVVAPISGQLQLLQSFNPDDWLPAGLEVLRIIPEYSETIKMEINVRNEDIAKLQLNQEVTFRFLALPEREFGVVTGLINRIADDIMVGPDGSLNYRLESEIESNVLYNHKGEAGYIRNGMLAESRIIVSRKKILYFLLEKLDFLT